MCFQTVAPTSQDEKICPLLLHSYVFGYTHILLIAEVISHMI